MRIRINNLQLAPGGNEGPSGLAWDGTPASQASDAVRSATPAFFDRKARHHTLRFGVTRQHASLAAAEAFAFNHARDCDANTTGTLGVLAENDRGQPAGGWTAPARILGYGGRQVGVTTIWDYQLEFGKISS